MEEKDGGGRGGKGRWRRRTVEAVEEKDGGGKGRWRPGEKGRWRPWRKRTVEAWKKRTVEAVEKKDGGGQTGQACKSGMQRGGQAGLIYRLSKCDGKGATA